jgi:hypothetical protein
MIYSPKTRFEGQKVRHEIAKLFADKIDLYGHGTGGGFVESKEAISQHYRYEVVIENYKTPYYVSEKFFDAIKVLAVPIYRGGKQAVIDLGFDLEGILFFDSVDDLRSLLDVLSVEHYQKLRPVFKKNRKRLLEIRNQAKLNYYLSFLTHGYCMSIKSYRTGMVSDLSLKLDR